MGESRHEFNQYCKVCDKVTEHESASYDDVGSITCLEHDEQEQAIFEARTKIQTLLKIDVSDEIQDLLHSTHTESNCQCEGFETATMISEGAGDMEICLECFGAKGCVY